MAMGAEKMEVTPLKKSEGWELWSLFPSLAASGALSSAAGGESGTGVGLDFVSTFVFTQCVIPSGRRRTECKRSAFTVDVVLLKALGWIAYSTCLPCPVTCKSSGPP